jgi:hypothetical protein
MEEIEKIFNKITTNVILIANIKYQLKKLKIKLPLPPKSEGAAIKHNLL